MITKEQFEEAKRIEDKITFMTHLIESLDPQKSMLKITNDALREVAAMYAFLKIIPTQEI